MPSGRREDREIIRLWNELQLFEKEGRSVAWLKSKPRRTPQMQRVKEEIDIKARNRR